MKLRSVHVLGLFDRKDIYIEPKKGQPVFLIGENGVGKSTLIKILYYTFSGQFEKLRELPFYGLEFYFQDHDPLLVEKGDLSSFSRVPRLLFPVRTRKGRLREWPESEKEAAKLMNRRRSITRSNAFADYILQNYPTFSAVNNFVARTVPRVTYFPTYRRVERDLKEVFGEFGSNEDEEAYSINLVERLRENLNDFGEIIGFGAHDIESMIADRAENIRSEAREALNAHSIGFLEVLATKEKMDTRGVRTLLQNENLRRNLLAKIENYADESTDFSAISNEIERLSKKIRLGGQGRRTGKEDMLLYYISELNDLTNKVDQATEPLIRLQDIVSGYLVNKKVSLDNLYNIAIEDRFGEPVQFEELSSGEKQVISFFAFTILRGGPNGSFLFIDEPELSLSVSWQKSLMRDLINSGQTELAVVATHSPFIIEDYPFESVITLKA